MLVVNIWFIRYDKFLLIFINVYNFIINQTMNTMESRYNIILYRVSLGIKQVVTSHIGYLVTEML